MQRKRQRLVSDELFENCGFQNGELDALISPTTEYGPSCLNNEDPTQLQLLPTPQQLGGGGFLDVMTPSPPQLTEADGDDYGILTGDEQSRTGSVHEARLEHLEPSFDHQWMSTLAGLQSPESFEDTSNRRQGSPETDGRMLQDARDGINRSKRAPQSSERFRPNEGQKRILEQHFLSGFARVTPELVTAVQSLGEATERQIAVWLKNRLARCKQHQSSHREQSENEEPFEIKQTEEDNKQALFNFDSVIFSVLDEMQLILKNVDLFGITSFCSSVIKASQIVCYGIGKEGHIMNKFASDLHCLGFRATCLSDVGTLPVSPKDLFIVSAGPSCYSSVSSLALEARRMGASVVAFTAHRTAGVLFTENFIRIPAQTLTPSLTDHHELTLYSPEFVSFLPEGKESVMNMGSSYEVGMSFVHASILVMLREALTKWHK